MLSNRPEAFLVDTAALHLGATPMSVYTTSSPAQLDYLFDHSGARVVVTEPEFAERVKAAGRFEAVFVLDEDFARLEDGGERDVDFDAAWRAVTPEDAAVLIYTSGTTGPPKGVELTHANVLAQWRMIETVYAPKAPGRVMSYLPVAHVADRFIAHYPALLTGTTVTCFVDGHRLVEPVAVGKQEAAQPSAAISFFSISGARHTGLEPLSVSTLPSAIFAW